MKKKELKLVITFHTTADAMAMEKECKKVGDTGRNDSGAEKYFSRMRAFLVRTTGMQGRTEKCHAGNRS